MFPFLPDIEINLDLDDEITEVTKKSVIFKVIDKKDELFYSISWSLVATVDGKEFALSRSNKKHSHAYLFMWTRQLLRSNKDVLTKMGVNVEQEYANFNGRTEDLYVFW